MKDGPLRRAVFFSGNQMPQRMLPAVKIETESVRVNDECGIC
jgi:hypothetical protein